MRIEAHGADGVRELRLYNPCPLCGAAVTGFDIGTSNPPIPVWDGPKIPLSSLNYATMHPCGHVIPLAGNSVCMYAYHKDTEGKKAYNAKALELARKTRREST
jgi:hypothetical protein